MSFSLSRARVLDLLGDAMEVAEGRRMALLGRFQHLQRLSLIEGINPGRGKAAEYRANQIMVIAIAFQMLQLGLSPERAVHIIKENQDRIRLAIGLAVYEKATIKPAIIWFDPSVINISNGRDDLAEATFDYAGEGAGLDRMKWFIVDSWVERTAIISISGTLWHIVCAFEHHWKGDEKPPIGPKSMAFLHGLREWYQGSTPESLA